ncbi:MAG TPA: tetratricopeptide repeat protein [Steroidobacteraceae bacterium]|jgi:tetratricopeptide (TPR) repeat protein|nr:tetratricopeptide repeat protein [Steroidobacteraceae bacterium]
MAEGLLDGVLGGEEEKVDSTQGGAEPFAAAVAANLANQSPEVAAKTAAFFEKQIEVLEVQKQNLQAEYTFFESERGPRLLALRLRTGFQIFFALFATLIGIGVAVVIYEAVQSRGVVIDPFDAPPALAASGVNGKVVAAGLLDELSRLRSATRSSAAKRDISSAWANDVQLSVPETGLTIGEISSALRARFGHDVHIGGDLVQSSGGGLTLSVRGDGIAPKSFHAAANELDSLTAKGAEYVYSQAEPALWAYFLQNAGRYAEAIEFCQGAFAGADKSDRPYLLNVWANALANTGGSPQEALALYRAAVKLKPDFWVGYNNILNALWTMGDEEGAWRAGEEMRRAAGGRPGAAPELYYQNVDVLSWNLGPWIDATVADVESHAGVGTSDSSSGLGIADVEARRHDVAAADLAIKTTKPDPTNPSIAAVTHFVRGRLAAEAGEVAKAAAEMESFGAAYPDPAVSNNYPGYMCWIAPVEEAAGHPDKADAVLKTAGTFVDCYRFRADIMNSRGDWSGAQKAYAQAVALAPDLPAGYYSWGVALARHGDLDAAVAKLRDASQKGPHWADPLKAWGDVLVQQGQTKDALDKYNEALKYAPNWMELKQAREAAAKLRS